MKLLQFCCHNSNKCSDWKNKRCYCLSYRRTRRFWNEGSEEQKYEEKEAPSPLGIEKNCKSIYSIVGITSPFAWKTTAYQPASLLTYIDIIQGPSRLNLRRVKGQGLPPANFCTWRTCFLWEWDVVISGAPVTCEVQSVQRVPVNTTVSGELQDHTLVIRVWFETTTRVVVATNRGSVLDKSE